MPTHAPRGFLAAVVVGLALVAGLWAGPAVSPEPVRYHLRFPQAASHYVEVEASVPTGGQAGVELMMAVWTPGSYLVREFSKNVEGLQARTADGRAPAVEKTRKNRWRIATGGAASVVVSYRVYGREMGVRSNWIERDYAFLNGAPTFVTLADRVARPHELRIELPPQWSRAVTALPELPDGGGLAFRAPDFDALVDSPIGLGNPALHAFEVDGKPHLLVNEGEGGVWDGPRSAADLEKIVREYRRMWGFLPYSRYVFLNYLTEGSGGLEHKESTLMLSSRYKTRTREGYLDWLSLASHEYLHAWNVKRLRPVELGPFDYEGEVYTKSLWISEGLTDYYGNLAVRRAGIATDKEYLKALSKDIDTLQTTPGRAVQPLEAASFDAWIKQYRPDENTRNTAISYYTKGAVVGFLLDAHLRRVTGGAKSLDDVMRLAYQRFAGPRGFTPEEFRRCASEAAGSSLTAWFQRALETTEELDYAPALDWYGLRFKPEDGKKDEEGEDKPEKAWLGLVTRNDGGRLLVTEVRRGTPGFEAGFNVDDEVLALGDFRVRPEQWDSRMEQYKAGERLSVLVARRDRLVRLEATLAAEPKKWRLEPRPDASEEQKARLRAWLGP
jgi:predicted metalloprotease with PDZ domain